MQVAPTEKSLELSKKTAAVNYGLNFFWAFPAGAGRAVAVSHGNFTNNNKVAVRPFSL